jgi:hypothetical protein
MKAASLLLAGLLLAAPVGRLSARALPAFVQADETLSDATAQQVLEAAAPQIGESATSLYAQYQSHLVAITDLGPIRGGHRYAVSKAGAYSIIIDLVING